MPRFPYAICTLAIALWPSLLHAEVVELPALERAALQNRPALAVDAARSSEARAQIDKAQSAYYPRLVLAAQSLAAPGRVLVHVRDSRPQYNSEEYLVQGARSLSEGLTSLTPVLNNQLGLQLDSSLYDFGRTRALLDASRAQLASSEAEAQASRAAIVSGVRAAYLAWLSASELYAIAELAATDAASRRARVEALIGEGARPQAELTPARTEEMLAKLELDRARGDQRSAKLALAQAVGSPLSDSAEPDRSLLQRDAEPRAPSDDATQRALEAQEAAAAASARAAQRSDAPLLSGSALAGVRAQGLTPFPVYALGLTLSFPLFDGGEAKAGASAARARADQIAARVRQHAEERNAAIDAARLDASNAVERLATAQALLALCEQREREAEQSYELGAGGVEVLAQARALLRRARTEVVLARVARAEAGLRMSAPPE